MARVIAKRLRNRPLIGGKLNPKAQVPLLKEQMTCESFGNKSQVEDLLQVLT